MAKATASLYLKLTDKNGSLVQGECYDAEHTNEISLTGWDWGVTDPAAVPKDSAATTTVAATGRNKPRAEGETGDKITPGQFSISKQTDKSTVRLINAIDNGEVFPTATLVIQEEFKASPLPFRMEIHLTDVFLVSMNWSANAAGAGMEFTEGWKLNYSNIKLSYLWRGTPAGWLDIDFDRPPDSVEGPSKKAPLTAAEQKAADDRRLEEALARLKKTGK